MTRVLGQNIPMKYFAATKPRASSIEPTGRITVGSLPRQITNLWHAVTNAGFNALCWSQHRPAGPIGLAIEELEYICTLVKSEFPGKPVALIGHSRGGLVARKFLEINPFKIAALITIATPHAGCSLARLQKLVSPVIKTVNRLLPANMHGTASKIARNFNNLVQGGAVTELMPGSEFIKSFAEGSYENVRGLSFGGTKPDLASLYRWKKKAGQYQPLRVMAIPSSLTGALPSTLVPDEIRSGKGDFMVTAKSARLPWAAAHYNVHANHLAITWNPKVIRETLNLLAEL